MLNPLKKTKNAWSLIFFNCQVLSANGLFIFESFLAFIYNLNLFKNFLAFITCLSCLKLKNFLKLVFKNEM